MVMNFFFFKFVFVGRMRMSESQDNCIYNEMQCIVLFKEVRIESDDQRAAETSSRSVYLVTVNPEVRVVFKVVFCCLR